MPKQYSSEFRRRVVELAPERILLAVGGDPSARTSERAAS